MQPLKRRLRHGKIVITGEHTRCRFSSADLAHWVCSVGAESRTRSRHPNPVTRLSDGDRFGGCGMWRKISGVVVALCPWAPLAHASSVNIDGQFTNGAGVTANSNSSFLLTGYNSDPNAELVLSLNFVNVTFQPFDPVNNPNQRFFFFYASLNIPRLC
jgi:hypothetical protein